MASSRRLCYADVIFYRACITANTAGLGICPWRPTQASAIYSPMKKMHGINLMTKDKCRGWRIAIYRCCHAKIYFNWKAVIWEVHLHLSAREARSADTMCSREPVDSCQLSRRRACCT